MVRWYLVDNSFSWWGGDIKWKLCDEICFGGGNQTSTRLNSKLERVVGGKGVTSLRISMAKRGWGQKSTFPTYPLPHTHTLWGRIFFVWLFFQNHVPSMMKVVHKPLTVWNVCSTERCGPWASRFEGGGVNLNAEGLRPQSYIDTHLFEWYL